MPSDSTVISELLVINQGLLKAGKESAERFLYKFLDQEDAIVSCLKKIEGVKSEIYLKDVDGTLGDILRFSSIFSDLTLVNAAPSTKRPYEATYFDPQSPYWKDRKLTIPPAYAQEIGNDPSRFLPVYMNRQDDEINSMFNQYESFIASGRLLIRPLRGMWVNHPGGQEGTLYYVDPNTLGTHWYINEVTDKDFISISNGLGAQEVVSLFELTLPYFKDVEVGTLSEILDGEADSVTSFRAKLKELIKEAGKNLTSLSELRQDVIQPAIDTLDRKFKAIAGTHRLSIGASVGTFAITLVIATACGNILPVLTGAVPTVGGAMALSERNYIEKLDTMKDSPYFLLWKIRLKS